MQPNDTHVSLYFEGIEEHLKENQDCYTLKDDIEKWQTKYGIKDKRKAKLNQYIYNNLIFLRSNEQIKFRVTVDLKNISSELYFVYRYDVNPNGKYSYQLQTEINECIYNILTNEQKNEFKDYILYKGILQSNISICDNLEIEL
jgi:hypothetical protein